jgi:hypothetical protein
MFHHKSGARCLAALMLFGGAIILCHAPSPGSPVTARRYRHAPAIIHQRHGGFATSGNWSGYAVTGADGSVTDVRGSWTVPTVTCSAGAPDQFSASWVGIDGFNSNTVEQIGIEADCVSGKAEYSAWYEFYPHWPFTINTVSVRPGDQMVAEVSYGAKGQFTVTLTNTTAQPQQFFSTSTKMPQAKLSSAEWIVEAPWSSGILPLADFNTAFFGNDYTLQPNTCNATVGKKSGPIGSFGTAVTQIDMESNGVTKAHTSALTNSGSSFTITWENAGQ